MNTTLRTVLIVCCLASCVHEPINPELTSGDGGPQDLDSLSGNCDPDKVYFEKDVLPILTSNCAISGCHDAKTKEEGFDFSTYQSTMAKGMKPGNPKESKLYKVITTDPREDDFMPPGPMSPLSPEQIRIIYDWIEQGAKDLTCEEGTCNLDAVTFSSTISTMITNYCTGCHSGSQPQGNLSLTNFSEVESIAKSGLLAGTVKYAPGYSAMPPNNKLSDCQIQQIEKWIADGSPDN